MWEVTIELGTLMLIILAAGLGGAIGMIIFIATAVNHR